MGIIKKLFAGKKRITGNEVSQEEVEIQRSSLLEDFDDKKSDYTLNQDKQGFVSDYCEQIIDTSRQLDEMKIEYKAVTSYLADMQKIDRIPPNEREQLNDTARKILTITRERAKYQNSTRKITDAQYKHIARYEDVLPTELRKMMKNEAYNSTIKEDMRYLEGEKGALTYDKEEIINKQTYLKRIGTITTAFVIILFILFFVIETNLEADMEIPFLMTILMALGSATYIFMNARTNRGDMKLTERKLNRAIGLMNKVKIKYINSTNELEYTYQKYMVNSYAELNYMWEQYRKAKEEEQHYNKNLELLEFHNRTLVKELRSYEVADPGIWVYQAVAILDNKEMVEIRHRLNTRRQKLRERIDYNNGLKERSMIEITKYINKNHEARAEVIEILRKHGIQL